MRKSGKRAESERVCEKREGSIIFLIQFSCHAGFIEALLSISFLIQFSLLHNMDPIEAFSCELPSCFLRKPLVALRPSPTKSSSYGFPASFIIEGFEIGKEPTWEVGGRKSGRASIRGCVCDCV